VGCFLGTPPASSAPSSSDVMMSTQETSSSDSVASTDLASSSATSQPATTVTMPTQPVVTTTAQLVNSTGAGDVGIMSKLSGLLSMLPSKPTPQPVVSVVQPSTITPSSSPSPPTVTPAVVSTAVPVTSDGGVTPVKDDLEENIADPPAPQQPRVVDPIALLNQMLSQSRPSSTTSSSSVNFLQSLTMLTKTVTSSGQSVTGPGDDEVFMGSYGKLDEVGSFTTTWSDRTRSDADTGPPVKPLDHVTGRTTSTTVTIPIPLASQSMGPPPLQSIYATAGISDIASCSDNVAISVPSPTNISATSNDHIVSSQSFNSRFPSAAVTLDAASGGGLSSEKFASRPVSTPETPYPLPGLDIDMVEGSVHRGGSLPETSLPLPFSFRPTDMAAVRSTEPADEFTERLRRKTSMRLSDGVTSPPFPVDNRGVVPARTGEPMFNEGRRQPPLEPPLNNFPARPPAPVFHDQPGVDAEYDRYAGGFDQFEMGDHNHEEFPAVLSGRPPDPPFQNRFQHRPTTESAPMFPRPDFYPEPRRRMPNDIDFRPRFRPMSRLPPPAAFSVLRSPPPPPPERFQRPFFTRF